MSVKVRMKELISIFEEIFYLCKIIFCNIFIANSISLGENLRVIHFIKHIFPLIWI